MRKRWNGLGLVLIAVLVATPAYAQLSETELRLRAMEEKINALFQKDPRANYGPHGVRTTREVQFAYGSKGFHFETGNGLFSTNLAWRAQMRYSGWNRSDPRTLSAFSARDVHNFEGRRLRMKIGGHGYKKWIKYYFEIDLQPSRAVGATGGTNAASSRVIDWRLDVQPWEWFGFRLGQWKINFNRERVDSSGKQQFVERSIVNRIFTIDRQVGIMAQGHLFKGTLADLRYYAGVFNGEGRAVNNPDENMMYMGRLQWNFLGRDLKWRQSDVTRHKKPAGSIAFAAAQNNGVCTRWSSAGCGALGGFTAPTAAAREQFNIDQYVEEFAFKWRGLSIQHEYHWKNIRDTASTRDLHLWGSYSQVGYFFNELFEAIPPELEVAFRYAFVSEPDSTDIDAPGRNQNLREEFTWAVNYFIAGHNNKVTLDFSYLTIADASGLIAGGPWWDDDKRIRLQWDITF